MSNLQPSGPVGDVTLFTAVDRTKDPGFFTHFLDRANELARTGKPLILEACAWLLVRSCSTSVAEPGLM
ncbi:MAG: hypothetical protein ACXVUE_08105 [Solirubrobacteraceae bacterium]